MVELIITFVLAVTLWDVYKQTDNWLRWKPGRQSDSTASTYYKKLLIQSVLFKFDVYLLRYGEGSTLAPHTDPVDGHRHFRANLTLWYPLSGGTFIGEPRIIDWGRLIIFRSDEVEHTVTPVHSGTRYVLSIGWLIKE